MLVSPQNWLHGSSATCILLNVDSEIDHFELILHTYIAVKSSCTKVYNT